MVSPACVRYLASMRGETSQRAASLADACRAHDVHRRRCARVRARPLGLRTIECASIAPTAAAAASHLAYRARAGGLFSSTICVSYEDSRRGSRMNTASGLSVRQRSFASMGFPLLVAVETRGRAGGVCFLFPPRPSCGGVPISSSSTFRWQAWKIGVSGSS